MGITTDFTMPINKGNILWYDKRKTEPAIYNTGFSFKNNIVS
jgi:hypothetical protein